VCVACLLSCPCKGIVDEERDLGVAGSNISDIPLTIWSRAAANGARKPYRGRGQSHDAAHGSLSGSSVVVRDEAIQGLHRQGTLSLVLLPVLFVVRVQEQGRAAVADALCRYLPSALGRAAIKGSAARSDEAVCVGSSAR